MSDDSSIPDPESLAEILEWAGFDAAWRDRFRVLAEDLSGHPDTWTQWQREIEGFLLRENGDRLPSHPLDWQILAIAQRMQQLIVRHRESGIDAGISRATVSDLSRWADSIQKGPNPGSPLPFHWFQNHLTRNLLEIGCLHFVPGACDAPVRIFRSRNAPSESMALAVGGIGCDRDGWPTQAPPAFTTTLEQNDLGFVGHAVIGEVGIISGARTTVMSAGWEEVFVPGETVLHVHIPEGSDLSTQRCRDSL